MRILFALVAWGNDYVRDFLDVSLPTLLAEGNLADAGAGSCLMILTTQTDARTFESDPLFTAVKRFMATEFIDISRLRTGDKYQFASRCQLEALRQSEDYDAVIMLYPDMVWCTGGVRFAVERIKAGALGVFAPAPSVLPEPTLAALRARARPWGNDGLRNISVSPPELAGIALRHHHPMWEGFDWDGGCFAPYPACLRWNVADQGWLLRCFHLHPVALRVQRNNPRFLARFTTSLDGEYVARLFEGADGLAFANDPSTFTMVTLRDGTMGPFPDPGHQPSIAGVARWAEANAFLLHRSFAGVTFRWHEGTIDEVAWQAAERRSEAILAEIRARLYTPDSIIRVEDPEAYRARKDRAQNPASRSRSTIELPPSYARERRSRLTAALLNNIAYRAVLGANGALGRGALGSWLRRRPSAVAIWRRTKAMFQPESEIYAAVSPRTLVQTILRHRGAKYK
jgi:hypothetical protein